MTMKVLCLGWIAALSLTACGSDASQSKTTTGSNEVKIHQLSDPEKLNPLTSTDANASTICANIFESLVTNDLTTYERKAFLIKALPEVVMNADHSIDFVMEFRAEAAWPDGSPITGNDFDFSLKLIKNPFINCGPMRSSFELFDKVTVDAANPKKFTVHCDTIYNVAETYVTSLQMLNAKVFDPKGLLKNFSVYDMTHNMKALENSAALKEQGEFFNKSFNTALPENAGSGGYQFDKWETFQRVVLHKNKNWWAFKLKDADAVTFHANPDKLIYETVTDLNTAVVALKANELDVMHSIPNRDFVQDMQASKEMQDKFYLLSPPQFAYEYIGINTKNAKYADVRVRQALSHLIDVDKIVQVVAYGLGERISSFIHPLKKEYYNSDIELPDYNVAKAKKLLADAGWKDSNGDGTVDKIINGEKTELEVNVMYNKGNERRKKICLYFLESAKAAGVKINIQVKEWSEMLDAVHTHSFELYVLTLTSSPLESDPKPVWHTSEYAEGSNYTGFGNKESDALIEKIRTTLDATQRAVYYKELQKMVSDQVPVIFLMAHKERIAINKRWDNVVASGLYPGYDATMFKLKP